MTTFIIIVLILVAGGSFYMYKQNNKKIESSKQDLIANRSVLNLKINDIVSYYENDYIVTAINNYNNEGYKWKEYLLEDGNERRWLSAEQDDEIELGLLEPVDDLKLHKEPANQIKYRNIAFSLDEKGIASVSKITKDGPSSKSERCKYYEYSGGDDNLLAIEDWGNGSFEVSFGKEIKESDINILPS